MADRHSFDFVLDWMHDEKLKKFLKYVIDNLPDYFFVVPASSSGKYHPSYALGDGGLVRHTQAFAIIAHELFNLEMFDFTEEERDLILCAIVPHDGLKQGSGKGQHTVFEHPILAANFIKKCNIETGGLLTDQQEQIVYHAIASHMGQWNTANYSKVTLPKPRTRLEKFVHLCDYLASRKFLELNFDAVKK